MTRRIAIASCEDDRYPDPEAPLVVAHLRTRGALADLVAWDAEVAWGDYDLVVVRSTWDYFTRLEEFLAWVDHTASVTRIVNPANVIRWNSHKGYLASLGEQGIAVLPMLVLPQGDATAPERLLATGWDEVVIKPAVDGGARQTLRAKADTPEAKAHLATLGRAGDVVVQPFATGILDGETSLLYFGGELSHAVRKVPTEGDYRVQFHHGGTELPHRPTPEELAAAQNALGCVPGRLTYARVDLVHEGGVPTVMELELVEPDLFLRADPGALDRFCSAVLAEVG